MMESTKHFCRLSWPCRISKQDKTAVFLGFSLWLLFFLPLHANASEFEQCLLRLESQAKVLDLQPSTINNVLRKARPLQRVIELDRNQPEFTSTFASYLNRRVSSTRVEKGRELYQQHRPLLDRITRQTGVPGQYLVAFWGLETNYGGYKGDVSTVDALATLACDQRRSRFFTRQLMAALQLIEQGDINPQQLRGSWAGALGHVQFMPTVYLEHARDGDGDQRRDLFNSIEDALVSAAHFLNAIGWQTGSRWGREVIIPKNFPFELAGRQQSESLATWDKLGVRDVYGRRLPTLDMQASLLVPAGHDGPAFLVYQNFKAIMGWNRSEFYAISVGHLADRIAGAGSLRNPPPTDALRLSRVTVKALQSKLNDKGFKAGKPDGIFGPASRSALRQFQGARGMIADGYIDAEVLVALGLNNDP